MTAVLSPVSPTSFYAHSSSRGHRPAPLTLTYSLNRNPSLHGGALISPVTPRRSNNMYSPRTASFVAQQAGQSPARSLPGGAGSASLAKRRGSSYQDQSRPPGTPGSAARRYSMPTPPEIEHFESLCKARFYEQDANAARQIENILKDASVTAANCYTKILSGIRAKYHEDVARERREATERSFSQATPDVFMTKEERKEKLRSFLSDYASKEMIGTHPFSKGLYTLLVLQATKVNKGGAGQRCLEWVIEEEVFMEAGGSQWTHDSIWLLKSTLGFEQVGQADSDRSATVQKGQSALLSNPLDEDSDEEAPLSPFGDEHRVAASTPTHSQNRPPVPQRLSTMRSGKPGNLFSHAGVLQEGRKRTFRVPDHMTNPELLSLAQLFPSWIATQSVRSIKFSLPSWSSGSHVSPEELEEGISQESDKCEHSLRVGTGHLQLSSILRAEGWEGTMVQRVRCWLSRILGLPC